MEYMSALRNELDDFKPSLFEILAENQLSELIAPSLRYLLAVATHRHPRYLLRALNSFDELYALLGLLVERYYLTTFGGSFTENFYGLKRERVLRVRNGEVPRAQLGAAAPVRESLRLRGPDVWKNLAVLVGVPYLKRKLDESYDVHIAPSAALGSGGAGGYRRDETLPPRPTVKQRLMHYYKWFLRNVYPSLNGAYYFSILAFSLAYLFDNTKFSSPLLWLIGTRIRRLGPADHAAIEAALHPSAAAAATAGSLRPGQAWRRYLNADTAVRAPLLKALKMLLPASIFALKFLEWWHASDFSRQLARKATEALDLPAPVVSGLSGPLAGGRMPSVLVKASATTRAAAKLRKEVMGKHGRSHSSDDDNADGRAVAEQDTRDPPPISSTSRLPILTVRYPPRSTGDSSSTDAACPICLDAIVNPTVCQTGFVFCYTCVFRWMNGDHDRQEQFMRNEPVGAPWDEDDSRLAVVAAAAAAERGVEEDLGQDQGRSREGRWETCKKKSGGSSNGGSSRAKATQDGEPDLGLATLEKAIEDAIARMKEDVAKLRTGGRFDPQLIEQLKVSLNKKKDTARIGDLAHVVPKGGRTIAVLLADEAHVKSVSSAISSSNFSLTPQTDPANPLQLNIPIPPPTRESRDAAVKAAKAFMEKATQAIKNARQDVNKRLKEMGQRKTITPDTLHAALKDMEKATQAGQKRVKEAWEAAHRSLQQ
ncbi:ubiquitin-protein ligase peroxin 12 [Ascosphaera acerosa]|nr:ubiquitin-protein ligase peroxin 12 [Ascosphaera acerosa]